MGHWLVVVPAERHRAERLYRHDFLELSAEHGGVLTEGDDVAVAVAEQPVVFGLGRVVGPAPGEAYDPDDPAAPELDDVVVRAAPPAAPRQSDVRPHVTSDDPGHVVSVRYTHRFLDDPVPWPGPLPAAGRPQPLSEADMRAIASRLRPEHEVGAPGRDWLVSVELPIEATSPAEAVREFWSYVTQLGPRELPAFVSPAADELRMQAYVLGDEVTLDPEDEE